ncbi:MAG TPA: complex I NDUFA9 subunit family protein [bacterium]|nr:complex I NDUFA9 subunit family protein [bacterium]
MKVMVTGATGFVGGHIVDELIAQGLLVRALVRPDSIPGASHLPANVELARADVMAPDLEKFLEGTDAVIHLVGIIRAVPRKGVTFERLHAAAAKNVLRAMTAAGVKRLVHMSALGAGPGAETEYFRTKWQAEQAVRDSTLDWTVIKPSVIFGPGDRFVNMLASQVRALPLVPVIGDGNYRLQPIFIKDVAAGFVKALSLPDTIGRAFEAGGPEEMTYNELLDEIAKALGRDQARKIHFPLALMQPAIRMMQRFQSFPITMGQLQMLLINNVCDPGPFFQAFDIEPVTFSRGIRHYIS